MFRGLLKSRRRRERFDTSPRMLYSMRRSRVPGLTVLVLGDWAHCTARRSAFRRIMQCAGIALTPDEAAACDLAIKWAPWSRYQIPPAARERLKGIRIVNDTHFDCAKTNVSRCFEEVFGYALAVDPRAHHGRCVAKSAVNARHDGRLVECPLPERQPDTVYERLVDNRLDERFVEDIRVPVVGERLPFAFLKYRPLAQRFGNFSVEARVVGLHQVCAPGEVELIRRFSRHIGLEYGELDVLRDHATGRLYIVDANNTPFGPPKVLSLRESDIVLRLLADAFVEQFAPRQKFFDGSAASRL